jgi:hypothetical protein
MLKIQKKLPLIVKMCENPKIELAIIHITNVKTQKFFLG